MASPTSSTRSIILHPNHPSETEAITARRRDANFIWAIAIIIAISALITGIESDWCITPVG